MPGQQTKPPAREPCGTCPYRREVASGVWDEEEYAKLPGYDAETLWQPPAVFVCHLTGRDNNQWRICAGWAGCHDGEHLLALRLAVHHGIISAETRDAVIDYVSPVPLFTSGAEAAAHGMRDIDQPGESATRAIRKIVRARSTSFRPIQHRDADHDPENDRKELNSE